MSRTAHHTIEQAECNIRWYSWMHDGGFRAPLNTPQPLAKNASLAFLTFSSIRLLLESEVDHQAPWHLAESMGNWDFNIVRPDGGGIARN